MDPLERVKALAISDAGFVFDPATGETYTLNETAREVVRQLKDGKSRYQIRDILLDKYECEPDQLDRDLEFFFSRLAEHGLFSGETHA